jgi:hypothetical protein
MSLYLAKGQSSNDVVALQNALNLSQPSAQQLKLDGIFGPRTEASVRRWQKCKNLVIDGISGPKTLCSLFTGVEVNDRSTVHLGASETRSVKSSRNIPSPELIRKEMAQEPSPFSFGTVGYLWGLSQKTALEAQQNVVEAWERSRCPKPELKLFPIPCISDSPPVGSVEPDPDVKIPGGGHGIVERELNPSSRKSFTLGLELGTGSVNERTLNADRKRIVEVSMKTKIVIPLAQLDEKKYSWNFTPPSVSISVGKKITVEEGEVTSYLNGQADLTPFTIQSPQWGQLGRVRFSIAPSLITSYIYDIVNKNHKIAFGGALRPEVSAALVKGQVYVGIAGLFGIHTFMKFTEDNFYIGYYSSMGGTVWVKIYF